eukprot:TRINITY_DN9897_c0_g8_i1.p1 TRINITY_DN9897_c0_g8~~TRINITY_DN9897_c0_g8_i1.p1  ORF type:complete len:275 (+),score=84.31 TRINITY_DN9897_c0_g8_i1:109-933(+)
MNPNHDVRRVVQPSQSPFKHTIYKTPGIKKPANFSAAVKSRPPQRHEYKKPPRPKDPESLADLDILCINCMKMVKASLVGTHSLHCAHVQSEVKLIDQCSLIQQADYKLRKLKDSILQLNKDPALLRSNSKNSYYIQMALEYCEDIFKITDFTKLDILKCREVIYNLRTLVENFKGSPAVMVHLERLLVISKEKYNQVLNYYKEIAKVDTGDLKTKEELRSMAAEKHEELRKSLSLVSEVRATILSERRSRYNPARIVDANRKDEVVSDAGNVE